MGSFRNLWRPLLAKSQGDSRTRNSPILPRNFALTYPSTPIRTSTTKGMVPSQKTTKWWSLFLYTTCLISPAPALPAPSPIPTSTVPLRAGTSAPKAIEPPAPKFKTTPDRGAVAELDLSVLARDNVSWYDDESMVVSTGVFMPGVYQARNPVGNG